MSSSSYIKTIFWDIGGVLLTNGWDKGERTEVLTRLGVDLADYESRHDEANYFWERGLSTAEEFFDVTVLNQNPNLTFEELWPQVCAESRILYPECVDILGMLATSGRYMLATLNNESRELNDYRLNAFRLRPFFDYFICSGYVHEMKPYPGIYRAAIEISGHLAETALFIDDKVENCDAAAAFGMRTICFESPAQLRDELAQFGLRAA
ncbi:HAD family hydrolase [Tunturibacter empetritectus]|uniref:Hydrolase of the HAD superfamily n=1 Tax=Tunturiibacter lichenicola TaxID=2051959 RepID=A0A7W8J8X8_9BACT|nr:HAD family phosphatase [Edaphobacter lichenicola]MBB5343484.1 putative hydrolase of the HAD superfamily [Edaphobacter lichenicola]